VSKSLLEKKIVLNYKLIYNINETLT